MKNSKLIKAVAAVTLSAVSAAACFGTAGCAHKHTWGEYVADDSGHHRICTSCDASETVSQHDYNAEYKCGVCNYQHTHKFSESWTTDSENTKHWHASVCGHNVISDEAEHSTDSITGDCVCGYHEHKYSTEWTNDYDKHWHSSTCGHDVTEGEHVHNYKNHVCEDCNQIETVITEYEMLADKLATGKDGWTDGMFTVGNGTEVRGRNKNGVYEGTDKIADTAYSQSIKLGGTSDTFKIKVTSVGSLVIHIQNGSSGTTGKQTVILTAPNGSKTNIDYLADGGGSTIQQVTIALDSIGEYSITRTSGTSDIFYAKFVTRVPVTAVESIKMVNNGTTEFYVGQELDTSKIAVAAVYKDSGRVSPIDIKDLVVSSEDFDSTKAGEYTVNVSYTCDDGTFNTSYKVKVYGFDSIELTNNYTVKEAQNSAAGNGVYAEHKLRQLYFTGDTFSSDGLVVELVGKIGTDTKKFCLPKNTALTFSGNDLTTAGKKTVTVSYTANGITKSGTFEIYVMQAVDLSAAEAVNVKVDGALAETDVGVVADGVYQFKTIQQAIDFLHNAGIKESAVKTITLAAGTYFEKLEITIPNLTIEGAGKNVTKIEYDELWGIVDPDGFIQTTDSTATLNVRDTAVGFTIRNVTISNKYNTLASYNGAASNDKRALAMLVQADKVVVDGCDLLGYQDTLELFTGRQLFKNCVISGAVDFIFGTNNTTYFYRCEIRSITCANGGGYITAFKGNNKGTATDKVTYGAIFDDCDFTADSGVSGTAIGRTWGADAAVMVMNSRLGGHISKDAGRYVKMNADPKKAQFTEYNNSGDGAVTSLTVGKVLSATEAANYNNLAVIFGTVNDKVTYGDVWNITLD